MRNKNFNYGYFFLVNSIFNKLDNIYFSFFDRWIFLNFLYKFLGSFGFLKHISFFIDKELLLLINRIFIFWFFIYIMVKLNDNRGFNLLSLRYFFIILVNLFFNRISESLVILGGFKINHKLSTEMRFLKKGDLSKRVYINKSFLKISFKKHALLLDENNNFITEPLVERNYIYPKWFSSDSYYFGHDDFKTKNVLFLFKNLFVFFFRKKFIVIKSNFLGSLILFRFFISNLFLKNSFFQLKHKF